MTCNKIMILLDMLMEHNELESIKINGLSIIYNPYMNDGEWEIFENDDESYIAYDDIYECANAILV